MNMHDPPESYKRGKVSGLAVIRHPTAEECRPLHRNALRAAATTTTASATVSALEFSLVAGISVSTGPIFTTFLPNGRYLREFSLSGAVLPIPQGTLP